jgi:hypothetical protein
MQNFDWTAFTALSPANARAAALQLFDAAQSTPDADWRGIAYAFHAVLTTEAAKPEKRARKVKAVDPDGLDDGFTPWADYEPGKGAARGAVTVTFADGWSRTVGMVAGKTAKGRKPWAIASAVKFAVVAYKLALARRVTGSDALLYHTVDGLDVCLDGVLACPEIVSVVSAEGQDSAAGDLIWCPVAANAATLDKRAGLVAVPDIIGPFPRFVIDRDDAPETFDMRQAISRARCAALDAMGYDGSGIRTAMRSRVWRMAMENLAWLECSLAGHNAMHAQDALRDIVNADREAYPMDDDMLERTEAQRQAIEADDKARAHVASRPVINAGNWTTHKDGADVCAATVFPDYLVIIGKWNNCQARPQSYDPATVIGLGRDQIGRVINFERAISGAPRGCRIAGPRKTMKRLRLALEAREAELNRPHIEAREHADEIVGEWSSWDDDFTKPLQWNMVERRGAVIDALLAWPALDEPMANEAPPAPALSLVASNPAPLALPAPVVRLCLPAPSPANRPVKPRYRLTAAGSFERIAA